MSAEGENWYQRCDDIACRAFEWINNNTETHAPLYIMIEEPINYHANRAWSAAIQNRLLAKLVGELTKLRFDNKATVIQTIKPTVVKKLFTGKGNAKKPQIIIRAKDFYRFKSHWTKSITETVADTIAIAYSCLLVLRGRQAYAGVIKL